MHAFSAIRHILQRKFDVVKTRNMTDIAENQNVRSEGGKLVVSPEYQSYLDKGYKNQVIDLAQRRNSTGQPGPKLCDLKACLASPRKVRSWSADHAHPSRYVPTQEEPANADGKNERLEMMLKNAQPIMDRSKPRMKSQLSAGQMEGGDVPITMPVLMPETPGDDSFNLTRSPEEEAEHARRTVPAEGSGIPASPTTAGDAPSIKGPASPVLPHCHAELEGHHLQSPDSVCTGVHPSPGSVEAAEAAVSRGEWSHQLDSPNTVNVNASCGAPDEGGAAAPTNGFQNVLKSLWAVFRKLLAKSTTLAGAVVVSPMAIINFLSFLIAASLKLDKLLVSNPVFWLKRGSAVIAFIWFWIAIGSLELRIASGAWNEPPLS
eukprot:GHVU01222465.1.p1 GENE.GHVU01222465.1~~GHVU01222465.1.p1  ORF type:complete len:376 (+),score=29.11 GHVU01222465.1:2201-3328(+)